LAISQEGWQSRPQPLLQNIKTSRFKQALLILLFENLIIFSIPSTTLKKNHLFLGWVDATRCSKSTGGFPSVPPSLTVTLTVISIVQRSAESTSDSFYSILHDDSNVIRV